MDVYLWTIPFITLTLCGYFFTRLVIEFSKLRTMENIPTSKIKSAAVGYVELKGRVRAFANQPFKTPYSGISCVWYRIEDNNTSGELVWENSIDRQSTEPFVLEDETGRCYIFPEGANVTVRSFTPIVIGDDSYIEEYIAEGEWLYVLGEHHPIPEANSTSTKTEAKYIFTRWLQEKMKLIDKYDVNNNGILDSSELRTIKKDAEYLAEIKLQGNRKDTENLGFVKIPKDERHHFIISSQSEVALIKQHRHKILVAFLGFFIMGSLSVVSINYLPNF